MSIPPLVCSTPPPPDQCEDDRDPDDFALQYNLSQDDEDDNYNYGGFTTYNHCHKSPEKHNPPYIMKETSAISNHTEPLHNGTVDFVHETRSPEKKQNEEEINIEDLNLEIDKEIFEKTEVVDQIKDIKNEREKSSIDISNINDELNIPNVSQNVGTDNVSMCDIPDEFVIEPTSDIEHVDQPPLYVDELIEKESNDLKSTDSDTNFESHIIPVTQLTETDSINTNFDEVHEQIDTSKEKKVETDNREDDEFGDFDDFQLATTSDSNNRSTLDDNHDNPWHGNEATADDFGNFKATFTQPDIQSNIFSVSETTEGEYSKDDQTQENLSKNIDIDDDFGDFDDFKSSSAHPATTEVKEEAYHQIPVLNLQSTETENQIMERINKVLSTIFLEEISEPVEEFESKLESLLGITWGHLLEVDSRQPYIVNWNNSLGQKTLLRALCIDSRNILIAPKWSYNTPKFAANLTTAPLQPQKPSGAQAETVTQDKTGPKTTWNDPFASDGQESGSTAISGEHVPIEIGPTDLDVFEASTSTKTDNIYSSTLNVQPIRQINLPDTHIFTPTDSETPRSKTIHYETPTILLPQTSIGNVGISEKVTPPGPSNSTDIDNDYWEFQDFKGPTAPLPRKHSEAMSEKIEFPTSPLPSSASVTFGTQVLQPVKVEPTMPTLNWPEPGEVKETFEVFSEFVSNSTWSDKQESPIIKKINDSVPAKVKPHDSTDTSASALDDDFDTFQSALPPQVASPDFAVKGSGEDNVIPQTVPQRTTDRNHSLPNNSQKSDVISFPNISEPSVSVNLIGSKEPLKTTTSLQHTPALTPSLLQPTPATFSKPSHNSSQILQPLSLESYSQINWPNPGIDLQDLSRFNPVETLHSLKSDLNTNSSKSASPVHSNRAMTNQSDDDWGEFVSSQPKPHPPKKPQTFADDDEWSDFVSSPSVKPHNGLNTISLNVHTNLNVQKSANQSQYLNKNSQVPFDIPTLNYITPKTNNHQAYNDRHFQNL